MIVDLLIGLPGDRPGGLCLTILCFLASALVAALVGMGYAAVCVAWPKGSLVLQAMVAFLRGVPLLLLVFLLAQLLPLGIGVAAMVGLVLYSFSHVCEVLRSFLAAYPRPLREQATVIGLGPAREGLLLRVPRTIGYSLDALGTHWVSLLKDTGALVVLSVGELTTVAKTLSDSTASPVLWIQVMTAAAVLYLGATLVLLAVLNGLRKGPFLKWMVM
jgi:ABC-type amino acid transport system permease subunit